MSKREERRFSLLIVEDDNDLRLTIELLLCDSGYDVSTAASAMEATRMVSDNTPDLILLDWMLPGMNGLRWLQQLRHLGCDCAVVLLTARTSDDDKEQGLAADVDDYIAKPFSNRELLARIAAVLRRRDNGERDIVKHGGLILDSSNHTATCMGIELPLNRREFALLRFFMTHPDKVHSRECILQMVWGDDSKTGVRSVDVHILWLRKKLAQNGLSDCINTVWGVGYGFVSTAVGNTC
ncbi:MAG: response regulator transcription factor [Candidatus Porifericomitaceae bacterium WSBS_2022_MAG_OTU9]